MTTRTRADAQRAAAAYKQIEDNETAIDLWSDMMKAIDGPIDMSNIGRPELYSLTVQQRHGHGLRSIATGALSIDAKKNVTRFILQTLIDEAGAKVAAATRVLNQLGFVPEARR